MVVEEDEVVVVCRGGRVATAVVSVKRASNRLMGIEGNGDSGKRGVNEDDEDGGVVKRGRQQP